MLSLDVFVHLQIHGWSVGIRLVMPVVAGTMIMIFGNYLPKLKSDWFIGIRTPWTLSSEESCRKTHRLGGPLFVICGALIILTSVLAPEQGRVVLFGAMIPAILASTAYSYFVWRNDPQRITIGERRNHDRDQELLQGRRSLIRRTASSISRSDKLAYPNTRPRGPVAWRA